MSKKKVALHIIMPNQTSGPNTANRLLRASCLSEKYDFCFITQDELSGGKVSIRLLRKLIKQIKTENPDLLHFSGLQSSGFHAVLAARLAGKKNILITIRGFSGDTIGLNPFKKFVFDNIIEPLTLKLSRNFYTVCHEAGERKMVKSNLKKYLGVIPNAAPILPSQIKDRDEVRKEIGIKEDAVVVAIVGRMVYDKGISFILDAIDEINNEAIVFVFVGDGPYEEIVRNKAKNCSNVFCLGKRSDVIEIVNSCDIFLFATLHENLSNALLEAMTCGLPVVATNIGGNVDVVEDGGNGYLISPSNSRDIADKVLLLAQNVDLRKKFSKRSIEIIEEKFSQNVVYAQLSEVYDRLLGVKDKSV